MARHSSAVTGIGGRFQALARRTQVAHRESRGRLVPFAKASAPKALRASDLAAPEGVTASAASDESPGTGATHRYGQ